MSRALLACHAWLVIGLVVGCRGNSDAPEAPTGVPTETSADATPTDSSPTTIYRYSVEELDVRLASYLPPLDQGRVEIAPPEKWHLEPRSRDYLVRFVKDRTHHSLLPRITVTVRGAEESEPADLTEENLLEVAHSVKKGLDQPTRQALAEPPVAMVIGPYCCVRYVINKRFRLANRVFSAEREVLQAHVAGRIYELALDAYRSRLTDDRARLYAVLAGMTFKQPGGATSGSATSDEDPTGEREPPAGDSE